VREIAESVVMAVILYAIISTLVGRYQILNVSMEPNFHEGQRVVVSRSTTAHRRRMMMGGRRSLALKRGHGLCCIPPAWRAAFDQRDQSAGRDGNDRMTGDRPAPIDDLP
jgi:hypothetical protein